MVFLTVIRQIHASNSLRKGAPKISKPTPRHFARRIFDELTKPVTEDPATQLAKRLQCKLASRRLNEEDRSELSPIEKALARNVRQKFEASKLLVVCHKLPMKGRAMYMDVMKLGSRGLMFKIYNNRVVSHVIRGTTLASLEPLMCGENCYLISDDASILPALYNILNPISWLLPLAVVVENRIMSAADMKLFQEKTVEDIIGELTVVLQQPVLTTSNLLTSSHHSLCSLIDQIGANKKVS